MKLTKKISFRILINISLIFNLCEKKTLIQIIRYC